MSDDTVLAPEHVTATLAGRGLDGWTAAGTAITRRYETGSWPATLLLVNAVGFLCEQAWHHAELHASYGALTIELTSHDAGGITERDLELAARIEEVVRWTPPADGGLTGPPEPLVRDGR